MINALHEGMQARIIHDGDTTRTFSVENGMKQGCVMAPIVIFVYLTAMLNEAFRDCQPGVVIGSEHVRQPT